MNFRNAAIWLVIVAVLVGMFVVNQTSRTQAGGEISYSQLLRKVDAGEIKSADIAGQIVQAKDGSGNVLTVNAPNNPDELVNRLVARGADVKFKGGGVSLLAILVNLLPIILVIGVWVFFMRQMQGG
ncbi:MAG: cell division protein FtsH, partial [Caulobacter sp. 35-67-4]